MATMSDNSGAARFSFWQKMAIGIAVLIVFGFAQFALRGLSSYRDAPFWVHLHGLAMLGWLGLLITQASLEQRGSLALHRKLGWIGGALVAIIVVLGIYAGIGAIDLGRVPPFFTAPFFLSLTTITVLAFAGMVAAAIAQRRDTQAHRRLMMGATIIIMEPALGRLLPMPLLGPWGEAAVMVIQLGVLAIVMRHDIRTLGHIHLATKTAVIVVVLAHLTVEIAARTPFVATLAGQIAA